MANPFASKVWEDSWALIQDLYRSTITDIWTDALSKVVLHMPDGTQTGLDPLEFGNSAIHSLNWDRCLDHKFSSGFHIQAEHVSGMLSGVSAPQNYTFVASPTNSGGIALRCTAHLQTSAEIKFSTRMQISLLGGCENSAWIPATASVSIAFDAHFDTVLQLDDTTRHADSFMFDMNESTLLIDGVDVFMSDTEQAQLIATFTAQTWAMAVSIGFPPLAPLAVTAALAFWAYIGVKGGINSYVLAKVSKVATRRLQKESTYLGRLVAKQLNSLIVPLSLADTSAYLMSQLPPSIGSHTVCFMPAVTDGGSGSSQDRFSTKAMCQPSDYSGSTAWQCETCGGSGCGVDSAALCGFQGPCGPAWGPPIGYCACTPQCRANSCWTSCGTLEPTCCGTDAQGIPGKCGGDGTCCYPACATKVTPTMQCGMDDSCGGVCDCPPPAPGQPAAGCVFDAHTCAVLPDAFVPNTTFFATGLATLLGAPVAAGMVVTTLGAVPTVNVDGFNLVVTSGINSLTQAQVSAAAVAAQRITYWSVDYYGQGAGQVQDYVLSCHVNSIGRYAIGSSGASGASGGSEAYEQGADSPYAGPFYLVDPDSPTLFPQGDGTIMSRLATPMTAAQCTLTPLTVEGSGPDAGRALVIITSVLSTGVATLANVGGTVAWAPGEHRPHDGSGLQVLWLFGGCQADGDCVDKATAPYCQVGNTCGNTPTLVVGGLPRGEAVCATTCASQPVPPAWVADGFPRIGQYVGSTNTADVRGQCYCQGFAQAPPAVAGTTAGAGAGARAGTGYGSGVPWWSWLLLAVGLAACLVICVGVPVLRKKQQQQQRPGARQAR